MRLTSKTLGQLLGYTLPLKILDIEIINSNVLGYSVYILFILDTLTELHDILTTHVLHPIEWQEGHKVFKIAFGPGGACYQNHYQYEVNSRADDIENGQSHLTSGYPDSQQMRETSRLQLGKFMKRLDEVLG